MGYRTYYSLDVDAEEWEALIAQVRGESDDARLAIEADGGCDNEISWDDHESEIARISRKYPEVLFTLWGQGEETTDLWVKYFQNGRVQHGWAEITYPEFDESMLKEVISQLVS